MKIRIQNNTLGLILTLLWNVFIIIGTAYLVFWEGHSGWWFLLALILLASWNEDE